METEILMDQYGFFPKDTDRTVIPGWYRWYLLSGKRLQFAIEDGPVEVVNLPIKHGGYFQDIYLIFPGVQVFYLRPEECGNLRESYTGGHVTKHLGAVGH